MRKTIETSFSVTVCVLATLLLACSPGYANPITPSSENPDAGYPPPDKAPFIQSTAVTRVKATQLSPSDLTNSIPANRKRSAKTRSRSDSAPDTAIDEADRSVPDIPWEAIEHALKRESLPRSGHSEPEIELSAEYQQLIVDSLPDFALDSSSLTATQNLAILDFLRVQSASLSTEIAVYTSDIAVSDDAIAMAANGNLEIDESEPVVEVSTIGEKRPSLLKKLLLWGLGLLVLYTALDAIIAKLLRRGNSKSGEPVSRSDVKPSRTRRRRSFRRPRVSTRTS